MLEPAVNRLVLLGETAEPESSRSSTCSKPPNSCFPKELSLSDSVEFPETGSFESRVGLRGADLVRWVAGGLSSHLATHPVGDQFNYSLSHLGNSEREKEKVENCCLSIFADWNPADCKCGRR